MEKIGRMERRGSETDTTQFPTSDHVLEWQAFNSDLYSTERKFSEVERIANENINQRIDLRPYMQISPHVCFTTDKFQKILDVFRFMQLRQLCVINPVDGQLKGVISRENIHEYMNL